MSDREKLDRLLAAAKQVIESADVMMASYRIPSDVYEKLVNVVNDVESK